LMGPRLRWRSAVGGRRPPVGGSTRYSRGRPSSADLPDSWNPGYEKSRTPSPTQARASRLARDQARRRWRKQ
jgi:hypothetical protein